MNEKTIDKSLHISVETVKEAEIVVQKMAETIGKAIYQIGFLVSLGFSADEALQKAGVSMQNAEVNKKMNWIPVSERLPETSGDYLVTTVHGYIKLLEFSTKYSIFNASDLQEHPKYAIAVKAWMPLPEPYKEN